MRICENFFKYILNGSEKGEIFSKNLMVHDYLC